MPESMPWSILLACSIVFGCAYSHSRHADQFRGSSAGFLLALNVSALGAFVVGLGLLAYYFTQVAWYWPLALFFAAGMVGVALLGVLELALGRLPVSFLAFAWPAAALWMGFEVARL